MRAHADGATSFFFMQQQQTMTIGIVMTRTRKTRPPTAAPTMMPRTAEPSAAGGGVRGGVGVGGVGGGGVGDSTMTYVYGWPVISVNDAGGGEHDVPSETLTRDSPSEHRDVSGTACRRTALASATGRSRR